MPKRIVLSRMQVMCVMSFVMLTSLFAQTGARYLIITHDSYYDAIQPLAQWKQQKGMMCVVVRTSQIGTSSSQIRDYILNACNTWNPRPEFVLLVGSGAYVPAFSRGSRMDRILSDNPYVNISGDYRAELPYGRFPCRTARQCSVMVAKTLAYERTPYLADTAWFRTGTTAVNDSHDTDGWRYWQDARFVAGLARDAGYARFDSFSSSRQQNATNVVQSINSGTSFVLYRGSATANWYTPFAVNPSSTNNGTRLPIVCSFTCQTMSLGGYQYDSMVGDAWVKVGTPEAPKGAVAFVGNTHSDVNVADIRSAMTHGYFAGVFLESLALGWATLRGKEQIFTQFNDSIEYQGFNLFGDPELNIWTGVPQPLDVSHDSIIEIGVDSFSVTVSQGGQPLPGALVCIQDTPDSIYQYGYTDANGRQQFALNTTRAGVLDVTVTRRNCLPYEWQVGIGLTGLADRVLGQGREPRCLSLNPNPARKFTRISWLGAAPQVRTAVKVFRTSGQLVRQMSGPSPIAFSTEGLSAGIYVVKAVAPAGTATALLRIVK